MDGTMSATSIEAQRIDELIAGGTISDDDVLSHFAKPSFATA